MVSCDNCRHFRSLTPIDTALAEDVRVTGPEVVKALDEVGRALEDERLSEWEQLRNAARRVDENVDRAVWETPPLTTGYCASRAGQDGRPEIGMAGVRVREAPDCGYQEGKPEANSCDSCEHRVVGHEGADRAARALASIRSDSILAFGGAPPVPGSATLSQDLMRSIGPLAAHEIRATVMLKGVLPDRPGFVSYCAVRSTTGRYLVCAYGNRHGDCTGYRPRAPTAVAGAQRGQLAPPPPPAAPAGGLPDGRGGVLRQEQHPPPPPPAAPSSWPQDGRFAVVDGQSYTHPSRYVQVGYGLFPFMIRAQLSDRVEQCAIYGWDPAAARWNPYSLASLPSGTWCTLADPSGNQLPILLHISPPGMGPAPEVMAKWL